MSTVDGWQDNLKTLKQQNLKNETYAVELKTVAGFSVILLKYI